jgi:Predicted methyltransferase
MISSNIQQTNEPTTMNTSLPLPIPKDPHHVYTVSDLNNIKHLLSTTVTHPALIVPSKLTSSLRTSLLKPFLLNIPKIKDVYPLLLETTSNSSDAQNDDTNDDDNDNAPKRLDPKLERKIVLRHPFKEEEEDEDGSTAAAAAVHTSTVKAHTHPDANITDIFHHPTIQQLLNDPQHPTIRKSSHDITIGYDHFTVDQVLSRILPKEELTEIPSSFEVIGPLAHITLREEYYPYKYIIGRIILDKNKGIKVVVNKIGTIQNEFRTFPMELLADDRPQACKKSDNDDGNNAMNLLVEVREDGCRFQLDFEKVYWNSRLQYEHKRIVHLIGGKSRPYNVEQRKRRRGGEVKDEDVGMEEDNLTGHNSSSGTNTIVVADACAGIGPFAIPLTSQYDHVEVYANDLNPESYKYLNINAKLNKCHANGMLHTYNMDGRDFLRMLDEKGIKYDHVLMNLPAIAPEFLNVFRGWKGNYNHRPMIHVHCFAAKVGGDTEAVERCGRSLGCKLDLERDEVSVHQVRNVSPKKNMYCVSFRLPEAVKHVEFVHEFLQEQGVGEEVDNESEMVDQGLDHHDEKKVDVNLKEKAARIHEEEEEEQEENPCVKKSRIETYKLH